MRDLPVQSSVLHSIKNFFLFSSEVKSSVWKKMDGGDNYMI